jgi:hypothetical protein
VVAARQAVEDLLLSCPDAPYDLRGRERSDSERGSGWPSDSSDYEAMIDDYAMEGLAYHYACCHDGDSGNSD